MLKEAWHKECLGNGGFARLIACGLREGMEYLEGMEHQSPLSGVCLPTNFITSRKCNNYYVGRKLVVKMVVENS